MKKKATNFQPGRITLLRELLQMSQVKFANKIRISQGALSQIESGKSQLSFETLHNLSKELNVNCNWIVNGVGNIFSNEDQKMSERSSLNQISATYIPLVDEEAHAGYIESFDDPEYIKKLNVYQIPGFENGTYRLFEIEGESMIPTIFPREIVICESVTDNENLENGTLCILITKDGIVAKRVYLHDKNKDLYILKSDNSAYKTYSIEGDRVLELWRIKGKITSVFVEAGLVDAKRMEKLENDIDFLKQEVRKLARKNSQGTDYENNVQN